MGEFAKTSRTAKSLMFDGDDLKNPMLPLKAIGRGIVEAGGAADKAASVASDPRSLQAILQAIYSNPNYERVK
jgi:hypothetical protein